MEPLPLSVLIDRLEADAGARDRAFVRGLARWMHEKSAYLTIDVVERLGLRDVVCTFQMKERVKLIVTGYPPDDLAGEVTVGVNEVDFPHVRLHVSESPIPDPYEMCTLDYSLRGRRVRVTNQNVLQEGFLVVAATVGERQENRVQLSDGQIVTLPGEVLEFVE